MKRLLITGADGFTGRHLYAAAEQAGFEVFCLRADLTDRYAMCDEIAAILPTHVAHLAAISAVTHADQNAFYAVNVFGSLNLLDALKALPIRPERVLLASSANVYGNVDVTLIAESVCPKPVNHYGVSKLAMEHLAATYSFDLPLIFVRPFNYTGAGHDIRFVIPKIVEHFKRGATTIELGNVDVYRECNDVRMICDAYLKLLMTGRAGGREADVYNVCTGHVYSLRQVIKLAEDISGRRVDVKVNPKFVRANDVHKLAGDPGKLKTRIGDCESYCLEDTLRWMFDAGC